MLSQEISKIKKEEENPLIEEVEEEKIDLTIEE